MGKTYSTSVGCWNCDGVYDIKVRRGIIASQYLMDSKIKCLYCGCDTLKVYSEYNIERETMKDVILHAKLTQLESMSPNHPVRTEHQHFG